MSAPTPATGDGSPTPGYYPDPSIPGYIRYWNGAAWVPGTSRPAPKDGEAMPQPPAPAGAPAPASAPAVEETGPVFFDEEGPVSETHVPSAPERPEPEPASVWQADTARQTGFGGDRDRRISWGTEGPEQPQPVDPRLVPPRAAEADPTGGALPGVRNVEPGPAGPRPPAEGTMTIRATPTHAPPASPAVPAQPLPSARPFPSAQPLPSAQPGRRDPVASPASAPGPDSAPAPTPAPAPAAPVTHGPGGGAASWAQQVQQLAQPQAAGPDTQRPAAQPDGAQPVVPWKPPVDDPFLRAARARAAARPAALGKRLVARLIDTVVLGAAAGAVAVPFVRKALDHIDGKIQQAKQSGETVTVWLLDGTTSMYFGIALAALLVLGVLYEALPTAKWGRTLGKKLCGLQVRDIEAHEPPGFGAALRRWLVYSVLGVLVIGVVNVVWCLFDRPWRQCWHDKAAHTFVAG
ncbi:RDD family protein [Streptomyces sp. HMX112]|uniref:RDD family protein n=1 Tax=Streptomyces sp. HMX112 TaxID=3390850 RepID=UPI003A812ECF